MKRILSALTLLLVIGQATAEDFIVIVLDTSGSMNERMRSVKKTRMEVAQDALVDVLKNIPDTTNIGILTFDGWIYPLSRVNKTKLEKAIRLTRPDGGTPLWSHMQGAGTELLKKRQKEANYGSYKILAVTDGEAGDEYLLQGRDGIPGVLDDLLSRGLVIDAIGLDMEDDHSLATQVNGSYMQGDDPNTLRQAVAKSVAEVGFGTQDAIETAEESFQIAEQFSDQFADSVIRIISRYQNQPIGEKPKLIEVVDENGEVTMVPNPAAIGEGSGATVIIGTIVIAAVIFVLIFFLVASCKPRGY